jgi:aspartyl-tRNA(Asn)/glutamyl-tRNA(Gln) amidotransferase subunit C
MSAISREEVANLARLARIEMSDAELDHLSGEMQVILGAVARVQEVASADVPPTSHPIPVNNVVREDAVIPSLSPTDALSGAPASSEQRFKVPQILGEAE